jgi:two-component system, chemotaxis family, chemotaxis protein CheY
MFVMPTILLVDDHSSSRQELHEIFRGAGYMVVGEARTTDDALDQLVRLQPDAVIMDVSLPGQTDPLMTIKQMRRLNPAAVILATGSASQGPVLMEALTMGAADFLMKPFQQRAVQDCLQQHVG